ncbi:MAG: sulfatase-like hydrolase/transferase [Rubrobacter sp.]
MARTRPDRPNVIVFFTDQQRWDTAGVHGNPLDLTPNLDRMAGGGTHLSRSFTCQPVCGPARSSLQTGLYATQTGCFRNGVPLPTDARTMAHHFREAGYETGYVGKWHLAGALENGATGPVEPGRRGGYEYWLASNMLEFTSDAYDTVLYDGAGEAVKLPGYRVDALTDASIRYIDANRDTPFFLFVSFLEPHHQNSRDDYPAPEGYRERYNGRWMPPDLAALGGSAHRHLGGYFGMVRRLDEALGRMLDALRSLGLEEDTVVLFTSDHGCHFKTRNDEYKRSVHDASIRVPTALQGPGFWGGGKIDEPVSLVDLPPTLLDAAGIPVPEEMQGRSVLPLLRGGAEDWPEEVFVQVSESEVGRAVRTCRWKSGVAAPGADPWNDAGSESYAESYLYDLLADPYELNNLVGMESHSRVAEVMRERLLRRMAVAGEAKPQIRPAPRRPTVGQLHVEEEDVLS